MTRNPIRNGALILVFLIAAALSPLATAAAAPPSLPSAQLFTCSTILRGTNEVPPNASPGTGTVSLSIDTNTGQINGQWSASGLSGNITAAHIHQAPVGVNGPIVLPFSGLPPGGGSFTTSNTNSSIANSVVANPSGFYINVHTQTFPGGEIRGQLSCSAIPTEVPEADGLVLFGSGLGGLATWLGWHLRKLRSRRS